MLSKIGAIASIVVILLVLIMGYLLYSQNNKINKLEDDLKKAYGYSSGSIIPEDVLDDITILKNTITEMKRLGPDTVIVTERYLPPESEVRYVAELDDFTWNKLQDIYEQLAHLEVSGDTTGLAELRAEVDNLRYNLYHTTIEFDTYGFCIEPVIGLSVNDDINEEIVAGARLFYYDRYGIGLHGVLSDFSEPQGSVGGFVDGRLPYFNNVGGFLGGSYNFTDKDWNVRLGLQGYLN